MASNNTQQPLYGVPSSNGERWQADEALRQMSAKKFIHSEDMRLVRTWRVHVASNQTSLQTLMAKDKEMSNPMKFFSDDAKWLGCFGRKAKQAVDFFQQEAPDVPICDKDYGRIEEKRQRAVRRFYGLTCCLQKVIECSEEHLLNGSSPSFSQGGKFHNFLCQTLGLSAGALTFDAANPGRAQDNFAHACKGKNLNGKVASLPPKERQRLELMFNSSYIGASPNERSRQSERQNFEILIGLYEYATTMKGLSPMTSPIDGFNAVADQEALQEQYTAALAPLAKAMDMFLTQGLIDQPMDTPQMLLAQWNEIVRMITGGDAGYYLTLPQGEINSVDFESSFVAAKINIVATRSSNDGVGRTSLKKRKEQQSGVSSTYDDEIFQFRSLEHQEDIVFEQLNAKIRQTVVSVYAKKLAAAKIFNERVAEVGKSFHEEQLNGAGMSYPNICYICRCQAQETPPAFGVFTSIEICTNVRCGNYVHESCSYANPTRKCELCQTESKFKPVSSELSRFFSPILTGIEDYIPQCAKCIAQAQKEQSTAGTGYVSQIGNRASPIAIEDNGNGNEATGVELRSQVSLVQQLPAEPTEVAQSTIAVAQLQAIQGSVAVNLKRNCCLLAWDLHDEDGPAYQMFDNMLKQIFTKSQRLPIDQLTKQVDATKKLIYEQGEKARNEWTQIQFMTKQRDQLVEEISKMSKSMVSAESGALQRKEGLVRHESLLVKLAQRQSEIGGKRVPRPKYPATSQKKASNTVSMTIQGLSPLPTKTQKKQAQREQAKLNKAAVNSDQQRSPRNQRGQLHQQKKAREQDDQRSRLLGHSQSSGDLVVDNSHHRASSKQIAKELSKVLASGVSEIGLGTSRQSLDNEAGVQQQPAVTEAPMVNQGQASNNYVASSNEERTQTLSAIQQPAREIKSEIGASRRNVVDQPIIDRNRDGSPPHLRGPARYCRSRSQTRGRNLQGCSTNVGGRTRAATSQNPRDIRDDQSCHYLDIYDAQDKKSATSSSTTGHMTIVQQSPPKEAPRRIETKGQRQLDQQQLGNQAAVNSNFVDQVDACIHNEQARPIMGVSRSGLAYRAASIETEDESEVASQVQPQAIMQQPTEPELAAALAGAELGQESETEADKRQLLKRFFSNIKTENSSGQSGHQKNPKGKKALQKRCEAAVQKLYANANMPAKAQLTTTTLLLRTTPAMQTNKATPPQKAGAMQTGSDLSLASFTIGLLGAAKPMQATQLSQKQLIPDAAAEMRQVEAAAIQSSLVKFQLKEHRLFGAGTTKKSELTPKYKEKLDKNRRAHNQDKE